MLQKNAGLGFLMSLAYMSMLRGEAGCFVKDEQDTFPLRWSSMGDYMTIISDVTSPA